MTLRILLTTFPKSFLKKCDNDMRQTAIQERT